MALIDELRKGQNAPVHMIDQVSRALPEMTWLTGLQQDGYTITIQGRCLTLTSLSDFVGNLEASRYFARPVEIVDSSVAKGDGEVAGPDPVHDSRHVPDGRHRPACRRRPDARARPARRPREGNVASLSLTKLPWYAQLAVFVVASLAVAGAFYYLVETKEQQTLATKAKELATIRTRIGKGSATARQLPEFRKQVGELEARLEGLKPILPEEKDVGDLLRRIAGLATQSNLTIKGFRPQPINQKEMHAEWPISIQLDGTYHNLGLFLDRVSRFPRIINVGSLQLSQKEPPTPQATMDISCTATTFVLVEKPVVPDTKKKAAAKKAAPAAKSE